MSTSLTLILGGARSGKSRHGLQLAETSGLQCCLIATATAGDEEMATRIAHHKAERGAHWRCVEHPLSLAEALQDVSTRNTYVVVDCITLWLANLMFAKQDAEAATQHLIQTLERVPGPVALVSNEVGFGLVPETEMGRTFRDIQGRANQMFATAATRVVLVVAGLPMVLKQV
jgi:adenosylcobinamide kinase/adenosylcobinamide-phosphate guanylyltransferase